MSINVRKEEEERFPYGLPREKADILGPVRGEEEEEGADLPLRRARNRKVRRDLGRALYLGDDLSQELLIKEPRKRPWSHGQGAFLSLRDRKGGMS